MDPAQIAALVGTALGAAASAYLAAKRRVGRDHAAQLAVLRRQVAEIRDRKQPTLSDERVREIVEHALREYVTVEEFRAYAELDGERRDKLIEKVGELRGTLAEVARRR